MTDNTDALPPTAGPLFSKRKAIADKLGITMTAEFNAIVREAYGLGVQDARAALAAQQGAQDADPVRKALRRIVDWDEAGMALTEDHIAQARATLAAQVPDGLFADAGPAGEMGKHFGCHGPIDLLSASPQAPAAQAEQEPVADYAEPLKGWKLNHVQFERGSGKAEIGWLDPEDDRFSPVVTVDTGLYYEKEHAHPLACAILEALKGASPQRAVEPLKEEHINALYMSGWGAYCSRKSFIAIFREAERAHGITKEQP